MSTWSNFPIQTLATAELGRLAPLLLLDRWTALPLAAYPDSGTGISALLGCTTCALLHSVRCCSLSLLAPSVPSSRSEERSMKPLAGTHRHVHLEMRGYHLQLLLDGVTRVFFPDRQ